MDTRFCLHPTILKDGTPFPCGNCPVCRMKYRKQMALRIYMEKCIEKPFKSYFLTLTYNDQNIPLSAERQCFDRRHITRFLDSLRHRLSRYGLSLRYFGTCEYGEEGYRPHYHFITFLYQAKSAQTGFDVRSFRDRHFFNREIVGPLWRYGFTYDGTVTGPSIMYCTAYALKDDEALERDWRGFEEGRPFRVFSLKPGLGLTDNCVEWWQNYVFNDGNPRTSISIKEARSISSGVPVGVKRKLKERHPFSYEYIKDANMRFFEGSVPELLENARRHGPYRDYRAQCSTDIVEMDLSADNEIKAFRKALRRLHKSERTPV